MKKRYLIIMICIFSMFIMAIGCSGTQNTSAVATGSTTASSSTKASTAATTATAPKEKVQIELFYSPWASTPYSGIDPYEAYLEKKYQCDFFLTPTTDFKTQLLTRAAGKDMPDLILIGNNDLRTLYDQGVLLDDWSSYLKNMPKTSANISDLARSFFTVNKKMIGCPGRAGDQLNCFNIRKDWLTKLGLSQPKSFDDLLAIMRAFTLKDPDGNGSNDTFGFTAAGGNKSVGELRNLLLLYGHPNIYIKDGSVSHPLLDGSFISYLKLAKTIVSEKLIDPNWYTQGWDERKPNLYAGKFGICWYPEKALLTETDEARKKDESALSMWETMNMFSGKLGAEPVYGAIRTVSAEAAADKTKMDIICQYLENCAYPNEDYFIIRDGYKIDGYDIFKELSKGVYYIGKSSPSNVTVRVSGSIMYGWGQMVQAQGAPYMKADSPEPTKLLQQSAEQAEIWSKISKYEGDYLLLNPEPTMDEESNRLISEFELNYILGNTSDANYDAFVAQWQKSVGNDLLNNAKDTFKKYGIIK